MKQIMFLDTVIRKSYEVRFCDKSGIKLIAKKRFIVTDDDIQWAREIGFITTEDTLSGEQTEYDATAWLMVEKKKISRPLKVKKYIIVRNGFHIEDFKSRLC